MSSMNESNEKEAIEIADKTLMAFDRKFEVKLRDVPRYLSEEDK